MPRTSKKKLNCNKKSGNSVYNCPDHRKNKTLRKLYSKDRTQAYNISSTLASCTCFPHSDDYYFNIHMMTGAKGFSEVVGKPLRRKYKDIYRRTIKIRFVMVPCLRFQKKPC